MLTRYNLMSKQGEDDYKELNEVAHTSRNLIHVQLRLRAEGTKSKHVGD